MILKINHRLGVETVKYFNNFSLNLKYDSVGSTFAFNILFDPEVQKQAEFLCVSHFHEATVEHEGQVLITGYMLSQVFKQESTKQMVQIGGYSKPGVLEDCEIPTSAYPLQTDGLSFRQIVERIIAPFKLKLIVDEFAKKDAVQGVTIKEKADKTIPVSTAKESQNIKSYFTELAKQRHIILSHDNLGNLLLTEANTTQPPIAHFESGIPGTKITMSYNGQGLHSHITVIKQADSDGGNAGEYTLVNPLVQIVYRPKVVVMSSGDDISIREYALNILAAELKDNIKFMIETDRWKINGNVITPNNMITITCPEIFIYNQTKLFIEGADLVGDSKSTTATYTCVLPEVYNGQMPTNPFVNPHENFPRKKK